MSIRQQIDSDIKEAMKARDKVRLSALRFVAAKIKQREVDERKELSDDEVLAVLIKQVKQHRESIEQYQQGGREDLVQKEQVELEQLQGYLPQPLSAEEVEALIADAITHSAASQMSDMGKVMAILKPKIQGRVNMKQASQQVRTALQSATT
ncbi:MAG: GatB/YqeY domain-containing protein [Gammaproteobacteria bacterium]|nr:GatB/YqeY domain-containing protein [Gammaproteobacteria bacterium]